MPPLPPSKLRSDIRDMPVAPAKSELIQGVAGEDALDASEIPTVDPIDVDAAIKRGDIDPDAFWK